MQPKRTSAFDLKRSNGKISWFGHLVLGCQEIHLSNPWFIVSTKIRNDELGEFDQQFLSFNAEYLSRLLDILEDEKEERIVYVVTAIAHDPNNGMRIDRLREVWRATDAKHPLITTTIYVLDDGHQFIRQVDCTEPVESLGESRLLVRV